MWHRKHTQSFQQIYKPPAFTLLCYTTPSSWNWVHMTKHNIHSSNYPHSDDVTWLFNLVWTETRLMLSLVFHWQCPQGEPLFHYAWPLRIGMYSEPIKVIDWCPTSGQRHDSVAAVERVFRSSTRVKVEIKQGKNTPLQVKVQHSKWRLNKGTVFSTEVY